MSFVNLSDIPMLPRGINWEYVIRGLLGCDKLSSPRFA